MTINNRGSRIIEVIETLTGEGAGTVDDPYREVAYYYNRNGVLLAKSDPATFDSGLREFEINA